MGTEKSLTYICDTDLYVWWFSKTTEVTLFDIVWKNNGQEGQFQQKELIIWKDNYLQSKQDIQEKDNPLCMHLHAAANLNKVVNCLIKC